MKYKHNWLRFLCSCLALLAAMTLTSCNKKKEAAAEAAAAESAAAIEAKKQERQKNIALLFPNEYEPRWVNIVDETVKKLDEWSQAQGTSYSLEVGYANDNAAEQAEMVRTAADGGIHGIIIAPVDSYSQALIDAVDYAKLKDVSVLAYDRLVMNTEAVDTYVTYDPYLSGRMMAEAFLEKLGARTQGVPRIEIFVNNAQDSSARYFYSGAMDLLKPMIDNGSIIVASGRTEFAQVAVADMQTRTAEMTMSGILNQKYPSGGLDGVLTQDDSIALGVIQALEKKGYAAGQFPIVTGSGCYKENIAKLIEGKQALSLFRDERIMGPKLAAAIDHLVNNKILSGLERTTYNNGKKIVPSLLEIPVLLDSANYKDLLLGSEYYIYTDINP